MPSPQRSPSPTWNKELWTLVLCAVLFFCGLFTVGIAVRVLLRERAAMSWPTASAVIVESFVRQKPLGDTEARIVYRYVVDGQVYKSSQVRVPGIAPEWRESPESLVERFPTGKRVDVPYNPRSPGDAYLVVGVTTMNYVGIAVSSVVTVLFGWAFICDWRAKRRKPPVLSVSAERQQII